MKNYNCSPFRAARNAARSLDFIHALWAHSILPLCLRVYARTWVFVVTVCTNIFFLDKQHKNSKVSKKKIAKRKLIFTNLFLKVPSGKVPTGLIHGWLWLRGTWTLRGCMTWFSSRCWRWCLFFLKTLGFANDLASKFTIVVKKLHNRCKQTYTHRHMPQKSKLKVIIHHKIGN